MKLILKNVPEIKVGIKFPIMVYNKIVLSEHYTKIQVGQEIGKVTYYEYCGTITYTSISKNTETYKLGIVLEDDTSFINAMTLFFKETKGVFKIDATRETTLIDEHLMKLGFKYKGGVYTYVSL